VCYVFSPPPIDSVLCNYTVHFLIAQNLMGSEAGAGFYPNLFFMGDVADFSAVNRWEKVWEAAYICSLQVLPSSGRTLVHLLRPSLVPCRIICSHELDFTFPLSSHAWPRSAHHRLSSIVIYGDTGTRSLEARFLGPFFPELPSSPLLEDAALWSRRLPSYPSRSSFLRTGSNKERGWMVEHLTNFHQMIPPLSLFLVLFPYSAPSCRHPTPNPRPSSPFRPPNPSLIFLFRFFFPGRPSENLMEHLTDPTPRCCDGCGLDISTGHHKAAVVFSSGIRPPLFSLFFCQPTPSPSP